MTYKQLIDSIKIVAKYNGGLDAKVLQMWAEHDEHGIYLNKTPSAGDLRTLALYGWGLGCDAGYAEDDRELWENADSLSDEEIVELFKNYNSIYLVE